MYCNQADSAILKLTLVQASMEQIYLVTKQTYVVITLFCRGIGYVPFTRVLSGIAFCREYAVFGFVLRIFLRRHLEFDSDFAQISGQNIATGETSPAITPYHTYHFSISTSLTFITSKLPSQDDFYH